MGSRDEISPESVWNFGPVLGLATLKKAILIYGRVLRIRTESAVRLGFLLPALGATLLTS